MLAALLRRAAVIGSCVALGACGSGGSSADESGGFDLPTALSAGGPVLASPRVQPIYFSGFLYPDDIDLFTGRLATSTYWPAVVNEYGVGAPTVLPGYRSGVATPANAAGDDLSGFLSQALAEGAATVGPPRADTIYVLFVPGTTAVVVDGLTACTAGGPSGFHTEWTVAGVAVAAAVIPTCDSSPADSSLTGVNVLTPAVSHEIVEAATDPFVSSKPAYIAIDGAHALWAQAIGGSEIADLCENDSPIFITPPDIGYPVQRIWSNVSARSGAGPCVPIPAGEVYFNGVAALPDHASYTSPGGTTVTVPALSARVGQDVSAQVSFRGGVGAPATWAAVAIELDASGAAPAAHPKVVTGSRGETLPVPVAPAPSAPAGVLPLVVGASDGVAFHFWVGAISRQ